MPAAAERITTPPAATPFRDGSEHLLAELERLGLMLHAEILRMRAASQFTDNQFRGLYVADEQIDALRYAAVPTQTGRPEPPAALPELDSLARLLNGCERRLRERGAASRKAGVALPLERLTAIFSLSQPERDALLVAIAPEIDPRFEILYSYAQNDVTRKRPSVGLALRLLGQNAEERIALRNIFSADGSLMTNLLVRFSDEAPDRELALPSRTLRTDERVVDVLLGRDNIDSRLRAFTTCAKPSRNLASLHFPKQVSADLQQVAPALSAHGGVLFFHGPTGSGKSAAAEALSANAKNGPTLITADIRKARAAGVAPTTTLALLRREARLREANLLLAHIDSWISEEPAQGQRPHPACEDLREFAAEVSNDERFILFMTSQSPWPATGGPPPCEWTTFAFPVPDFACRSQLWQEAIAEIEATENPDAASALANQFVLTGGQILAACRMALAHAEIKGCNPSSLTITEFQAAARAQSNQSLCRRARKVDAVFNWPDVVLPPRALQQLREVCAAEKYRNFLFTEWGFDRRLMQGKGLNVLFCGPSGTGKTMSAGIVARELGLDLYKIDLSSVISKYIGETEKHLSEIFREAQSSNAILFFDEADAIFGKRSEVKDAHDRYANVEVSYLLQKMEEYEGIVILATNFRRNIDDAFTRRIQYIVEFPFPEAKYRERIWRGLVPSGAPLAKDIDFGFLARQFELAGGSIRNAALVAAFLAAEEKGEIRMEHFVLATARELQKIGKLPTRSDFKEYYDLTHDRI